MATHDEMRRRHYEHFCDLIWKRSDEDVRRFVENEGITSEEYYNLWARASDKTWFLRYDPLRTAALVGSPDILRYLISLGFDPHGAYLGGEDRPIHSACRKRPTWLDLDENDNDDKTIKKKNQAVADKLEVVRTLVEDYKVNVNLESGKYHYTPLLYAAHDGLIELVKFLVKAGADIHARTTDTALHLASLSGSSELCEYFISLGLKVDEPNEYGDDPLYFAVAHGHIDAAEVLLDAGADVNWKDEYGRSHLGKVLQLGNLDMIRLLCSRGAKDEQDEATGPFLHRAIENGDYDIVRYLLVDEGFSLKVKDSLHNTPFAIAMKTGNMEAAKLLISCGCTIEKDVGPETVTSDSCKEWEEFVKDIQDISVNPRRLGDICCFKIRSLLGRNIKETVNVLRIPSFLKSFLLLKHI